MSPALALSRRAAFALGAAALAAPALLGARAARAQAAAPASDPASGALPPAIPLSRRLTMGETTITTLLAATKPMTEPQSTFGLNASAQEFGALSAENRIPPDRSLNMFTPVLVETGGETILFDTGLDPAGITAALAAAGRRPEEIGVVVLTHMHPDHIGGLSDGTTPTFPAARYLAGQIEWDHWAKAGNEIFEAKMRPLAEKTGFVKGGETPLSGITAIEAFGHTPGHMAWRIEDGDRALILSVDTANHYVWSLQRPDWEVKFDMDKTRAAETRKRLLGQIADEGLPFIGYHMPAPGAGYLERKDEGFRFVPIGYQFDI